MFVPRRAVAARPIIFGRLIDIKPSIGFGDFLAGKIVPLAPITSPKGLVYRESVLINKEVSFLLYKAGQIDGIE